MPSTPGFRPRVGHGISARQTRYLYDAMEDASVVQSQTGQDEVLQGAPASVFFAVVRLNLYLLGHNLLKFDFIERVCLNTARYVEGAEHSLS